MSIALNALRESAAALASSRRSRASCDFFCAAACVTTWLMQRPGQHVPPAQERRQFLGRYTFEPAPEPVVGRNPEPAPQDQRVEELHAELPVTGPDLAVAIWAKGQMIDEPRLAAKELDIVGRRIGQRETALRAHREAGRAEAVPPASAATRMAIRRDS